MNEKFFNTLISWHYSVINTLIKGWAGLCYKRITPNFNYHKILIVRKGTLGDQICSLPAVYSIRKSFPHAQIHILTQTNGKKAIGIDSIIEDGYIQQTIDYSDYSLRTLFTRLRDEHYDAVIEIPQNVDTFYTQLRNLTLFRLASIRHGGGWWVSQTAFLKKYQLKQTFPNEQERILNIFRKYHLPAFQNIYPVRTENISHITELNSDRRNVAMAVGAFADKRRWSLSRFKEVAEWIVEKGFKVILIGDEKDRTFTDNWESDNIINLTGKLNIAQSAAILKQCSFTICNDSGPMHLSYAMGTPVLALFSARNYKGKWNPPDDGKNVVLSDYSVVCAGCMNKPCADNICMQSITVQSIEKIIAEKFIVV